MHKQMHNHEQRLRFKRQPKPTCTCMFSWCTCTSFTRLTMPTISCTKASFGASGETFPTTCKVAVVLIIMMPDLVVQNVHQLHVSLQRPNMHEANSTGSPSRAPQYNGTMCHTAMTCSVTVFCTCYLSINVTHLEGIRTWEVDQFAHENPRVALCVLWSS